MILLYLTLIVVAAIVLVLVVYLTAIAYYLWRTNRHLAALVAGLQATRDNVAGLPEHLPAINGGLSTVRDHLVATDRNLAAVERLTGDA
jgi:hypothetical protein